MYFHSYCVPPIVKFSFSLVKKLYIYFFIEWSIDRSSRGQWGLCFLLFYFLLISTIINNNNNKKRRKEEDEKKGGGARRTPAYLDYY